MSEFDDVLSQSETQIDVIPVVDRPRISKPRHVAHRDRRSPLDIVVALMNSNLFSASLVGLVLVIMVAVSR